MNVKQLIEVLQTMPPEADIGYVWDGSVRSWVEFAWLARNGEVVLADAGCQVYDEEYRPVTAPSEKEDRYWGMT